MTMREIAKRIPGTRRLYRFLRGPNSHLKPQGILGIKKLGHREYVGGSWELSQSLQFNFLISQGLQPFHHLWDIACGSLRAGVPLIRYLEPNHYHGIDQHRALINMGVTHELGRQDYEQKQPEFIVSDVFEFDQFSAPLITRSHNRYLHICHHN